MQFYRHNITTNEQQLCFKNFNSNIFDKQNPLKTKEASIAECLFENMIDTI